MHMEMVEKYAGAKGDIAGIYGVVRMESGLKFENWVGDKTNHERKEGEGELISGSMACTKLLFSH